MNDRQEKHLKILSEMDEKIVEEVTVERFRRVGLLAKRKKRRMISILSAAASFVILFSATMVLWKHFGTNDPVVPPTPDDTTDSTPITPPDDTTDTEPITPPDEKQIPVYEGMTIESAETVGALLELTDAPILMLDNDHNNGVGHAYGNGSVKGDKHNPNRDDEIDQDQPFGEDNLILDAAKDSLSIVGAETDMYYAKPNEDIYFVIHINNPDAFEILSFTINGTKYSSYMFEDGSDLETLILKYNVGNVEGIVEYTIDAIKYIDGTEIKDVRMEGDRTVKAGIYTEEIQPKLTLTAEKIGLHSLSFKVSIADDRNLIGGSEGKAYAVLYDGETIVEQTELKIGEKTSVTFDGLHSGKLYEYAIIGVFDSFDGNKVSAHTLMSKAFYTESAVTFDEINVTDNKLTYALKWSDLASNKTLQTLTLTQGENKTELDVNATEIALLSDTEYTLTATYEANGKTETIEIGFRTVARVKPTVELTLGEVSETKLAFSISETDTSNIGTITKIELMQGETVKATAANTDVRFFDGLLTNNAYTVRLTYEYDMNDGAGVQTVIQTVDVTTSALSIPTVDLTLGEVGETKIAFSITETDADEVGAIAKIELLQGEVVKATAANTDVRFFDGLLTNNTYTVRLIYEYDMNDGAGVQTVIKTLNVKTQALTTPTVSLSDTTTVTADGVKFVLTENDPNRVGAIRKVEMLQNETVVHTVSGDVRAVTGMSAGGTYTMKITYVYDLNDGTGEHTKEMSTEVFAAIPESAGLKMNGTSATGLESSVTEVVIPEGVTGIGKKAFYNCSRLTSVTIGNGVTSIGDEAFRYCSSLTSITIPNSVTGIGTSVFSGCSSLTNVTAPMFVLETMSKTNLQTVVINGGDSIGEKAFRYCSSLTSVTIGNGVTSIGGEAFYDCDSLTSVTIPNSVTSIGEYAFEGCSSLTTVYINDLAAWCGFAIYTYSNPLNLYLDGELVTNLVIPEGVTSIGAYAFRNCDNLTSVSIPNSVTSIGAAAFSGCSSLTSITIPNSVTRIDWGAFSDCGNLTSVTIGNGVTVIVNNAFSNCDSLTSITIPNSVTSMGESAFSNCDSLTSVTILNSETSIGVGAFSGCDSLTSVTAPSYVFDFEFMSRTNLKTVVINGGTMIHDRLFERCSSLTSVTIGNSVTSIGEYAFEGCSGLTSITIPNTVTSIGYNAFEGCRSLTNVTAPMFVIEAMPKTNFQTVVINGGASIGEYAFSECDSLTSITIPNSVTSIGEYAFYECDSLTSITIPNSVTSIGTRAFLRCSSLTSITIPNSVTSIADNTFSQCSSLTSVTIGNRIASIGNNAFYDCNSLTAVYITDLAAWCGISFGMPNSNPLYYAHNLYLNGELVTNLVIPEGVTSIGKYAFYDCDSLTSITIPNSVTSIGEDAFYNCNSLTSITVEQGNTSYHSAGNCVIETATATLILGCQNSMIPTDGSVTSIGYKAFYGCSSLTSITIPNSVTSIGSSAFSNCYKLVEVINHSSLNLTVDSTNNGYVAYYAKEVHNGTSKIVNVNDYLFYTYNNVNYLLGYAGTDTALTLPENYNGQTYEIYDRAFQYRNDLTSVTISNSVTSIGDSAFCDCDNLTSIEIPNSVTSIGDSAFCDCDNLTSIEIPNSVTSIGSYAFDGCSSLTSIEIPNSVTSIGAAVFRGCSSLMSITIPNSVTSIGWGMFYNCSSLTSITIPNSVTRIREDAFYGCDSLTSVTFENPNGWWYSSKVYETSGTSISSGGLANPSTAATYLKSTYSDKVWTRSEMK